jgi:hypothetical protein
MSKPGGVMKTMESVKDIFTEFYPVYDHEHGWDHDALAFTRINGTWVVAAEDQSPYDLIVPFVYHGMDGVSMLTMHGWAAGLDDSNVPPSQRPDKRRMRLYILMQEGTCHTAIAWQDTAEFEIMNEPGAGALADAIAQVAFVYTQSLLEDKLDGMNQDV